MATEPHPSNSVATKAVAPKIVLETSDAKRFEVDQDVVHMSETLKNMLDDIPESSTAAPAPIPLPNITSKVLKKVIEFCRWHLDNPNPEPAGCKKEEKKEEATTTAAAAPAPPHNYELLTQWDIDFCNIKHADIYNEQRELEQKNLDATALEVALAEQKRLRDTEQRELIEVILVANYLDIKPLLQVTCKTMANMIKGKTPDEICNLFNIKKDFTVEEEEQVRKENEWLEDGPATATAPTAATATTS